MFPLGGLGGKRSPPGIIQKGNHINLHLIKKRELLLNPIVETQIFEKVTFFGGKVEKC